MAGSIPHFLMSNRLNGCVSFCVEGTVAGFGSREDSRGQIRRVLNRKMGNFKFHSGSNGEPRRCLSREGTEAEPSVLVANTEDGLEGGGTAGFCWVRMMHLS